MTISRNFFGGKGVALGVGAENIISFKIKTRRKKALTHNIFDIKKFSFQTTVHCAVILASSKTSLWLGYVAYFVD